MYTISKEFAFSASHQLNGLPPEHQCSRLHGHNYKVIVSLKSSTLDSTGFVLDYGELTPVKRFIDGRLDHRHLNDLMSDNPTAENLAKIIYSVVKEQLHLCDRVHLSVGISETPKTWAWYSND